MNHTAGCRITIIISFLFCTLNVIAQSDTSQKALPNNALYMLDGKVTTKELIGKLDKETIKSVDVWKGEEAVKKFGEKGKNGVIMITTKDFEYEHVFTKAQKQAYFPGSMNGWNKYVTENLKYPQSAKQNKIEGIAKIQFLVDKEGNLYDLRLLEDPGYGIGVEAIRLLKDGPKWIPAEQNGQKVINRLVVPVTFKL